MRGHGDSAWDPQGRYLVEDHVTDLAGLVAQLGCATSWCGATRPAAAWPRCSPGCVLIWWRGSSPKTSAPSVRARSPTPTLAACGRRSRAGRRKRSSPPSCARRNPGMSQAVLDAYVRHGARRREDGRVVWKRDPNLVKGFVETDLWRFVRARDGSHALPPRRTQHDRGAGDAGPAAQDAAARLDRHAGRAGPLPQRRETRRGAVSRRGVSSDWDALTREAPPRESLFPAALRSARLRLMMSRTDSERPQRLGRSPTRRGPCRRTAGRPSRSGPRSCGGRRRGRPRRSRSPASRTTPCPDEPRPRRSCGRCTAGVRPVRGRAPRRRPEPRRGRLEPNVRRESTVL